MKTADEKFSYSVWFVLDKIKSYMIPKNYEISYHFDANIKRTKPLTYFGEDKALKFLFDEKVIREIKDRDEAEVGKPGEKHHAAFIIYHLGINRKFFEYYDLYKIKAFSQLSDEKYKSFIQNKVLEFIKAKKIGKKQGKLLKFLSTMSPVSMSYLRSKTKTSDLVGLVRDTRKSLKKSPFKIILVRSGSSFKGNAYQLIVIS